LTITGRSTATLHDSNPMAGQAASILTTVYHMLRDGTCYQDLGPEYFTCRNPAKAAARLANRIRNLGYHVEIRADGRVPG
jgi:hypothetical protein